MRARSVTHVEYEVLKAILKSKEIGMVIEQLRDYLTESNHESSQKRFDEGVKNAASYMKNLMDRRVHRLPKQHTDYRPKQ
jgi:DNA-binding transcriptional MerR regulator